MFSIRGIGTSAGETQTGWVNLGSLPSGAATLPLVIAQGARPGPVLAVIAAQHGDEYHGIAGALAFARSLAPERMAGTAVIVPCANVPAFTAGRRSNPLDQQDLNRSYPGRADGTLTERTAFFLDREVLPAADLVIDLHGGNEDLDDLLFAVVHEGNRAALGPFLPQSGIEHVWANALDGRSGLLAQAAAAHGAATLGIEHGGRWMDPRATAAQLAQICSRAAVYLRMVEGELPDARPVRSFRGVPVRSQSAGLFEADVRLGDQVEAGQRLGRIYDLSGRLCEEVVSPTGGYLPVFRSMQRILQGDIVALIGAPLGRVSA